MRGGKLARVAALEVAHAVRGGKPEDPARVALVEETRALLCALPAPLRDQVEARGARGVADLLSGSWELGGNIGDSRAETALRAYCVAFRGVNLWQGGSEAALNSEVQRVLAELGVDV